MSQFRTINNTDSAPSLIAYSLNCLKWLCVLVGILHFGLSSQAKEESSLFGNRGKSSAKESKRWTLQEWLDQKNRNALMDQWLVMNSPSPFEFMLGGASLEYKTRMETPFSETGFSSSSGELSAFAQMVGLTAEYENNLKESYSDVSGLINFRILGHALQTTSLTLSAGQRTRAMDTSSGELKLKNTLAQVKVQAYLSKYFGFDGFHRQYLASSDVVLGEVSGTKTEAGLFLDFQALRIFGAWTQDIQLETTSGSSQEIKRTGIKTGIKLFF